MNLLKQDLFYFIFYFFDGSIRQPFLKWGLLSYSTHISKMGWPAPPHFGLTRGGSRRISPFATPS